jgi:hypothetical protein
MPFNASYLPYPQLKRVIPTDTTYTLIPSNLCPQVVNHLWIDVADDAA